MLKSKGVIDKEMKTGQQKNVCSSTTQSEAKHERNEQNDQELKIRGWYENSHYRLILKR